MAKTKKRNATVPREVFAEALKAAAKGKSVDEETGTIIVTVDLDSVIDFLSKSRYTVKKTTVSQRIYKLNKHLEGKLKFTVDSDKRASQNYDMFLDAFGVNK